MSQIEFINSIAPLVIEDMKKSGILASVTIGQACLESGYGTSDKATQLNNFFGMKASLSGNTWPSSWGGEYRPMPTKEQDAHGNESTIMADFRKYDNIKQSIKDHSDYLIGAKKGNSLRYSGLSGCADYRQAVQILKDCGYATDIEYFIKLCSVIESNNLTIYDNATITKKPIDIINVIATANPCFKAGQTISPQGVMIHSVGCNQPDPMVFVNQWQSKSADTCVHAVLGIDEKVYQLLPWNHRGWHCGSGSNGSCNNTHISFEITEPKTIQYTGGSSWKDIDPANTRDHVLKTYQNAVKFTAYLCNEYGLNPEIDGVVISHSEGHKRGLASNHGDVEHIWSKFGLTMDQFRLDVKYKMSDPHNKSGWHQEDGGWRFYLGDTGECVKNDWYKYSGYWYWFNGAGLMISDTWYEYKGDWYWFDGNGRMLCNNWYQYEEKWYYFGEDGKMARDKWIISKDKLYRLTAEGSMFEGIMEIESDMMGALEPSSVLSPPKTFYIREIKSPVYYSTYRNQQSIKKLMEEEVIGV